MLPLTLRVAGMSREVGPVDWIEFHGGQARTSHHPGPLIRNVEGAWFLENLRIVAIECRAPLLIEFADPARGHKVVLGPYSALRVRDRYVFGGRKQLAKLAASGHWVRDGTDAQWSVMRIVPLASSIRLGRGNQARNPG